MINRSALRVLLACVMLGSIVSAALVTDFNEVLLFGFVVVLAGLWWPEEVDFCLGDDG
jgi:hypothetical protein